MMGRPGYLRAIVDEAGGVLYGMSAAQQGWCVIQDSRGGKIHAIVSPSRVNFLSAAEKAGYLVPSDTVRYVLWFPLPHVRGGFQQPCHCTKTAPHRKVDEMLRHLHCSPSAIRRAHRKRNSELARLMSIVTRGQWLDGMHRSTVGILGSF